MPEPAQLQSNQQQKKSFAEKRTKKRAEKQAEKDSNNIKNSLLVEYLMSSDFGISKEDRFKKLNVKNWGKLKSFWEFGVKDETSYIKKVYEKEIKPVVDKFSGDGFLSDGGKFAKGLEAYKNNKSDRQKLSNHISNLKYIKFQVNFLNNSAEYINSLNGGFKKYHSGLSDEYLNTHYKFNSETLDCIRKIDQQKTEMFNQINKIENDNNMPENEKISDERTVTERIESLKNIENEGDLTEVYSSFIEENKELINKPIFKYFVNCIPKIQANFVSKDSNDAEKKVSTLYSFYNNNKYTIENNLYFKGTEKDQEEAVLKDLEDKRMEEIKYDKIVKHKKQSFKLKKSSAMLSGLSTVVSFTPFSLVGAVLGIAGGITSAIRNFYLVYEQNVSNKQEKLIIDRLNEQINILINKIVENEKNNANFHLQNKLDKIKAGNKKTTKRDTNFNKDTNFNEELKSIKEYVSEDSKKIIEKILIINRNKLNSQLSKKIYKSMAISSGISGAFDILLSATSAILPFINLDKTLKIGNVIELSSDQLGAIPSAVSAAKSLLGDYATNLLANAQTEKKMLSDKTISKDSIAYIMEKIKDLKDFPVDDLKNTPSEETYNKVSGFDDDKNKMVADYIEAYKRVEDSGINMVEFVYEATGLTKDGTTNDNNRNADHRINFMKLFKRLS